MEQLVEQEPFNTSTYNYRFFKDEQLLYVGTANRTVAPMFRRIILTDGVQELCRLQQDSIFWLAISYIPVLGFLIGRDCPYSYYEGVRQKGNFAQRYFNFSGLIRGSVDRTEYSLRAHTGNNVSIFREDKQVGLIAREAIRVADGDRYKVKYSKTLRGELAAMLVMLSDVVWQTSDTSTSLLSWQYSLQIGGKKEDKTWVPED